MKKNIFLFILASFIMSNIAFAQEIDANLPLDNAIMETTTPSPSLFDDKMLLEGYAKKFENLPKDILLEMIKDETLTPYAMAAAVRIFKQKFSEEVVSSEKKIVQKTLLIRLNRSDSPFVDVEIMHTLCLIDRYQFFESMVPGLLQKLDHYNLAVNELAYEALNQIIKKGNDRPREARIIFNTLRKTLFLSRKRLASITQPGPRLNYKLKILRWSIKILGNQELKKLPKEALGLL